MPLEARGCSVRKIRRHFERGAKGNPKRPWQGFLRRDVWQSFLLGSRESIDYIRCAGQR